MERQDPQNLCSRGLTWRIWKGERVILVDGYILMELMSSLLCVVTKFLPQIFFAFCGHQKNFPICKSQRFWSDFFTELGLVGFRAQPFAVISLSAVPL